MTRKCLANLAVTGLPEYWRPGPLRRLRWRCWRTGLTLGLATGALLQSVCFAAARFPPPDFQSGYEFPTPQYPAARAPWMDGVDTGVLLACLALATWLAVRKRSRRALVWLSLFSVLYFGFYRKGCVCSVGALQNIAVAVTDADCILPLVVIVFFATPLLMSLWFGRVFCAGVCPLGALQDLVLLRPVRVPEGLARGLGLLPWLYAGGAVLSAVMGTGFLICKYDPFIGIFRLSGPLYMMVTSGVVILLCVFVGRAYCRFLCPYGVLLGLFARAARNRVSITPDVCIDCGLCADACPFGAIRPTTAERKRVPVSSRLVLGLALVPLLTAVVGYSAGPAMARLDSNVKLASMLAAQARGSIEEPVEVVAHRRLGGSNQEVVEAASEAVRSFRAGGLLLGAFLGMVMVLKAAAVLRPARRQEYVADAAECVGCGRCFTYCPREHVRRSELTGAEAGVTGSGRPAGSGEE